MNADIFTNVKFLLNTNQVSNFMFTDFRNRTDISVLSENGRPAVFSSDWNSPKLLNSVSQEVVMNYNV